MKKYNKFIASAFAALAMVSCNDLDTAPLGSTVTTEQKTEAVAANPDRLQASVAAIPAAFYNFGKFYDESYHNDLLFPSIMLFTDSRGMDMVNFDLGYNWFSATLCYDDVNWNVYSNSMIWGVPYKQLLAVNSLVQTVGTYEPEDDDLKFYLAQALAVRAYDYYTLAQYFQHTYVGNEQKPCVPIITEKNMDKVASEGCPRATVEQVYEQIMSDINKAIELLSSTSTTRSDKRYVDLAVAYGIRARVNLVMNKWADAAADAQAAIDNTKATPYAASDLERPGFSDIDDNAWMWGILVAETDRPVTSGICNFPSHMGSLNYGYASVGAWRLINKALYAQIPATDVRKGWWLNENVESPNLNAEEVAYVAEAGIPAYAQMKFGCYNDEVYTSTNANDIPLMRVEEMYLILAEAQAMAGDPATGAATLEAFVKAYRDAEYTCVAKEGQELTAEVVQDKVWFQRRIELWGEGFSYADMMRLKKDMDRRGGGFEEHTTFYIPTGDAALILPVPQSEIERNAQISAADQNPTAPAPQPVTE